MQKFFFLPLHPLPFLKTFHKKVGLQQNIFIFRLSQPLRQSFLIAFGKFLEGLGGKDLLRKLRGRRTFFKKVSFPLLIFKPSHPKESLMTSAMV